MPKHRLELGRRIRRERERLGGAVDVRDVALKRVVNPLNGRDSGHLKDHPPPAPRVDSNGAFFAPATAIESTSQIPNNDERGAPSYAPGRV
jgi:hypothetical protein